MISGRLQFQTGQGSFRWWFQQDPKARQVLFDEAVADGGVNDNNPGMHPGHELSDLRNVSRQPAAEAVSLHATAQIDSFPAGPAYASSGEASAPPMDARVEMPATARRPASSASPLPASAPSFSTARLSLPCSSASS
jgi:protein TonB